MCGIFGLVERDARLDVTRPAAGARMRDALAHRGPDGWGLVLLDGDLAEERSAARAVTRRARGPGPRAALIGHQRLAIIDLSDGGHQPRGTADRRYWITYNGEIYNHRELRRELEADGVRFQSASDTEVLLALYVREGARSLDRLRGMFAFAIWDDREGSLFLGRDRFGMKPLYWAAPPGAPFLFASEPKALLASGLVLRDPRPGSAALFLRRGCLPSTSSPYRQIEPLPPAHWARWDGDRLALHEYWSLPRALGERRPSSGGAQSTSPAAQIRQALVASVHAHMVSDVPVGVFLSGGLDSTALVSAVREGYDGPLRTFTVSLPGTPLDESALARRAAARYHTDHTEIAVTGDAFFAGLDRFLTAMDEPTVDGVNTFVVAGAARQADLKVVLSGLGGDEILGGYDSFLRVPRLRTCLRALARLPGAARGLAAVANRAPIRSGPKLAELLKDRHPDLAAVWRDYRALFTRAQVRALAGDQADAAGPEAGRPADEEADPFWQIARCEIEEFMIPQLLRDSDIYSMTWGLELRTPFVDHEFLRGVRQAGPWRRRAGESHKTSLFSQMADLLPTSHLGHVKRGFVLPFDSWLRAALTAATPRDEAFAVLRREARFRPIVDGFLAGRLHWSRPWALYVLTRFEQRLASRPRSS